MLLRFCNLCCRNVEWRLENFSRRYSQATAVTFENEEQSQQQTNNNQTNKSQQKQKKVPIIECKRSVLNFYKGMAYKKKQIIPLASQAWNHKKSRGDKFIIYPFYENNVENSEEEFSSFDDFNLHPDVFSLLEGFNIRKPLEIQTLGIPKIFLGCHTMLTAETGCGKTLAYLLPLMSQLLQWKTVVKNPKNSPFIVIVTPTRELAVQIGLESIKWCKKLNINVKMVTGGRTKRMMMNPDVDRTDILVGSFGVLSKLFTVGVYSRKLVRCIVLDEVDALFHETFEQKVKVFLQKLPIGYHQDTDTMFPENVKLILASATIPSRLENVLGNIVNVDALEHVSTGKLHRILVPQKFIRTSPSQKPMLLLKYIKPKVAQRKQVIVFCNSSTTSYWMKRFLEDCGISSVNLHGSMSLIERRGKYGEFINGQKHVLATTNAGARGLDTVMVNHILNYDFPLDTASYIHRCGRTGRVGTTGECEVTNFICKPQEIILTQKIEWSARRLKPIPIVNLEKAGEELPTQEDVEQEPEYEENIVENLDNVADIPY